MSVIASLRDWFRSHPSLLAAGLIVLTATIAWLIHHATDARRRQFSGLALALGTAYAAQSALALWPPIGIALYTMAIVLFVVWDRRFLAQHPERRSNPISISISIPIFLLILILACLARFCDLGDTPYGIGGDEALWTAKAAFYLSTGRTIYDADIRFRYTPVSYFSESLFFNLLDPSFTTARVQVATFSTLAVAFFALGAASLWGTGAGLTAGALLAVSIVDVAMGRVALVESQIALPLGLTIFCLGRALTRLRWAAWPWFLLTGIALGLGVLTFETFYPIAGAVALYTLLGTTRRRNRQWTYLISLLLLLIPLALLYPLASDHVRLRRDDHNKSGASLLEPGLDGREVLRRAVTNAGDVLYNFYAQRFPDFGVDQDGPIINAALVPFLVIGLAYLLPRWRAGHHLFLLFWLGLTLFPAPVLFGSPWVRVMFPAFPAVYAVIALFLMGIGDRLLPKYSILLSLVALLVLTGVNATIYLCEFREPAEGVKRRELLDLVSQHTGKGQMLFLLNWDGLGDFVEGERRYLPLAAAAHLPLTRVDWAYRLVSFGELLPLTARMGDLDRLTVIFDRTMTGPEREFDTRQATLRTWSRCYPEAQVEHTPSFTVYTLDRAALSSPACRSAFPPPLSLSWSDGVPRLTGEPLPGQTAFRPVCERLNDDVVAWVEAEALPRRAGWHVVLPPATTFPDVSGYLADDWQAGEARGDVDLAGANTYTVWARTYHHRTSGGPLTVQVGDAALTIPDDVPQSGWVWQRLGEVRLPTDESAATELRLRRDYVGYPSPFLLDALLFSRDTSFDPNVVPPWELEFEGPTLSGVGGTYRLDRAAIWSPGHYRCRLRLLGEGLLDGWGKAGVWSGYASLWIGK